MASIYGPVTDWQNDFDHTDPEYNERIHEIWDDLLNAKKCPVAHTERFGGAWLPITHDYVREIAYDPDHFTSRSVVVSTVKPDDQLIPPMPAPIGAAPPITSDPPFHQEARRLLLPAFAPKMIEPWEKEVEKICHDLIDAMGEREFIDAAIDYSQHIPVQVIARMLGFPLEDADKFRGFVHLVLESVNEAPETRQAAFEAFNEYLDKQIQDHKDNPRDDLTTFLMNAEIMGNKLSDEHVRGTIVLILIAGIDTTWSGIGSSLWHLAGHPIDRGRLVDNPDLIPTATEEFLRAYAPVTMARMVTDDYDFHGCPMKKDDWVLLPFPAANRDPEVFEDADKVIIDREENRHAAFGLGIHRCLGSNLARLEMNVATRVFLQRFPDFELAQGEQTKWSVGQVRGPRKLPMRVLARRSRP